MWPFWPFLGGIWGSSQLALARCPSPIFCSHFSTNVRGWRERKKKALIRQLLPSNFSRAKNHLSFPSLSLPGWTLTQFLKSFYQFNWIKQNDISVIFQPILHFSWIFSPLQILQIGNFKCQTSFSEVIWRGLLVLFQAIFPWLKIMVEQKCETIFPQVQLSLCQLSIKGNFCYHEREKRGPTKTRE